MLAELIGEMDFDLESSAADLRRVRSALVRFISGGETEKATRLERFFGVRADETFREIRFIKDRKSYKLRVWSPSLSPEKNIIYIDLSRWEDDCSAQVMIPTENNFPHEIVEEQLEDSRKINLIEKDILPILEREAAKSL